MLGVLAGQLGRIDSAIDLIGRAIAIDADVAMYHSNLGEIYRRSRQWEQAIAHFHRAIELKPDYAEAHNNLGIILWEKGRLDEALALFRHAIALRPHYAEAHSNLGNVLKDQGRFEQAVDAYRGAIELKPDPGRGPQQPGQCLLASRVALTRRSPPTAGLSQLEPDDAEAHNNLGNAFKDQGHLDEALACFRKAVELKPDYAEAASNLCLPCIIIPTSMPRRSWRSIAGGRGSTPSRWRRRCVPTRTTARPIGG